MSKEENPRVSFRLAGEKHKRLKRIAVDCDTTLEKLLNTAAENWLYDYDKATYRESVDLQAEIETKQKSLALFALDTEAIAIEAVAVLVSKGLTNGHPDVVATYIKQVIDTHAKTN